MICPNCGNQIPDNVMFCPNCGAVINKFNNPIPPQQPQMPGYINQPQPIVNKNNKMPLIIGGAIIGVFLLFSIIAIAISSSQIKQFDLTSLLDDAALSSDTTNDDSGDNSSAKAHTEATESIDESTKSDEFTLLDANTLEGSIQSEIIGMNSSDYTTPGIDIYANNYTPGSHSLDLSWSDEVFYPLEGYKDGNLYYNKNICTLEKKAFVNAVTGNTIEYEIYINPHTNVANKIISIERFIDGIEVTEYYFDNNKKVNFVYQYLTDNYVSTHATLDKAGNRYQYCNDVMVNWRQIERGVKMNYCLGQAEYNRLRRGGWTPAQLKMYSSFDQVLRSSYDNAELRFLNAAYNTYNYVMNAMGVATIEGYVYDLNSHPIEGADVYLYSSDFSILFYKTTTDYDGKYMIYVPSIAYTYAIRISKPGMSECEIYMVNINSEQLGLYQDTAYLFDKNNTNQSVYLTLGDALNYNSSGNGMLSLNNALVNVRPGINNRTGNIIFSGTTDANGYIVLNLPPGVYTIEVIAPDYETMYYTIIANPAADNIYEFYAAPTMREGQYAIVLTWGLYPYDLDSHLFTTRGSTTDHIWYGKPYDNFNSYLDVDDTTSYGPETVTINDFKTTDYYKYCVVDYTDCSSGDVSSYSMSASGATVNVYSHNGLIGSFHVPTNTPGVIWEIFEIRNGQITPIQRYYNSVTDKSWWHSNK